MFCCKGALSQYMVNPKLIHLVGTKHVMMYLKGTLDYGLRYASNGKIKLDGFTDSDRAASVEDKKRTLGCCFSFVSGMISWFNKSIPVLHSTRQKLNT